MDSRHTEANDIQWIQQVISIERLALEQLEQRGERTPGAAE